MCEILEAKAKVNLFLDITSKRSDGFHNIESAFHTIDLKDIITIEEIEQCLDFSITTSGVFALDDVSESNILYKVCKYFENALGLKKKYKINIEKNIAVGAGLGGGSSDAASIIKFLATKIDINLDNEQLKKIASIFGADVSFFIDGGFSWACGIGEVLEHIDVELAYPMILIYPNVHSNTKKAYSLFDGSMFNKGCYKDRKPIFFNPNITFDELIDSYYNIFEGVIVNEYSDIKNCYFSLEKILRKKVCMSGSGSSLFIIYKDNDTMESDFYKIESNLASSGISLFKTRLS